MTGNDFSDLLNGYEQLDIQSLVRRVHRIFRENRLTLAVAESVTGGLIASRLTDVPGASDFFLGGAVCYQPKAKIFVCGVQPATLNKQGAVSSDVTQEMAEGIKKRLQADISMAITGVAGPEPGTFPNKGLPGLVYIAVAKNDKTVVKRFELQGTRAEIRDAAVESALRLLIVSAGRPFPEIGMQESVEGK